MLARKENPKESLHHTLPSQGPGPVATARGVLWLREQEHQGLSCLPRLEDCPGKRRLETMRSSRSSPSSPETRLHLSGETVGGMLKRLAGPFHLL